MRGSRRRCNLRRQVSGVPDRLKPIERRVAEVAELHEGIPVGRVVSQWHFQARREVDPPVHQDRRNVPIGADPVDHALSSVGAYAVNTSITDVYWMIGFGVIVCLMSHYGYPLGLVILSLLLDDIWRRAVISERKHLGRFFEGVMLSPLSLVLFVSQNPLRAKAKALLFSPKEGARQ